MDVGPIAPLGLCRGVGTLMLFICKLKNANQELVSNNKVTKLERQSASVTT